MVQCRRAKNGCLAPLAQSGPNPPQSQNPSDLSRVFGPKDRHPPPPCTSGGCPHCNLPRPCDNACKYKDKFIPIGQTFLPRAEDPCRVGHCIIGHFGREIKFRHERCSICPKDCIEQPVAGKCCPTCNCGPVTPEACPPLEQCPQLSCPLRDQYTPYQECCPRCDYCNDQVFYKQY